MNQTIAPQTIKNHTTESNSQPTVLVFAGLDPTGGAGIQADIETLASLNVHALPIVTCLTVQDTQNAKRIESVDVQLLQQQVETLLDDIPAKAIKLGLLSSIEVISLVSNVLKAHPSTAVIFDPILRAGGGANLTAAQNDIDSILKVMREQVIPYTTLITPNSLEARLLTGEQDLDDCAKALLALGCKNVLITGEHEKAPDLISNVLYTAHNRVSYNWPRLPHHYHGSGCTLASAISAFLVKGSSIENAVEQAQKYTDATLQHAIKLGQHQYHPNRLAHNLWNKE